ncbi:baseplate J/gp47 family protein [Telmatospirillum sp. J64-1]|uniref:baseplate J/gp47 family protein n=1 Tax=Telmatospirillum sp. J64-1 TaxID=2502183 RepID=UPI00115E760E|nr:baseplate J/gp47 family protein [Telmatospirillum sp. J64-1]
MPLAHLDETGLHLPDYPTILDYIHGRLREIYGEDLYLEPDSQDGQMAAIFAEAIHDAFSLAASVYNAFSPATAQGVSLSRQVAINGLRRKAATYSTVTLRVVGTVGTMLTDAVAKDGAGRRWLLDQVTIPTSGEALVTARAAEPGAIHAPAGDVSQIDTPILGWHSVSNPAPAMPGAPVESDADLRRRQALSTALPSRTILEGVLGAVAAVPGVLRLRGYENDGNVPDANGIPGHSIALVVEGGADDEIAAVIAARKTPGCGTFGTSMVTVRDRYGSPATIGFFRPTALPIHVRIRIKPLTGYLAVTGEAARQAVAEAINALGIGEDVLLSRLFPPVIEAEPSRAARTFDVLGIEIGTDPQALAPTNVQVVFNSAATAALDDILLELEP